MSLLVLAYPEISKVDFQWIQDFRQNYDLRYFNVVNPHFTIVFPVYNVNEFVFIDDVIKNSSGIEKIKFISRGAVIVKDSFSDSTDIFLVPDEGYSDILKLHDKLYSGILRSSLRLDITFIPHIGIGGNKDPKLCKKLADDLNELNFCIKGELNKLDIITYDHPYIKTIEQVRLL